MPMDAFIAAVMAQSQRVTSLSLTMSGGLASDLSAFFNSKSFMEAGSWYYWLYISIWTQQIQVSDRTKKNRRSAL